MTKHTIITKTHPYHIISEQYIKLKTTIDYTSFDMQLNVINITSTVPEEGKTVTALNLANVYAQTKKRVLLIDMDFRHPNIHNAFHIDNVGGLTGYATGQLKLEDTITHISDYFDIMHSGEKIPFPAELLTSRKVSDMMKKLRECYDMIIIDCPPLSVVADASIISKLADGTLYVVASRQADRDIIKRSTKELQNNGIHIIGTVLTKVKKRDVFYGNGYYYAS